jgi:hypothetical protein
MCTTPAITGFSGSPKRRATIKHCPLLANRRSASQRALQNRFLADIADTKCPRFFGGVRLLSLGTAFEQQAVAGKTHKRNSGNDD